MPEPHADRTPRRAGVDPAVKDRAFGEPPAALMPAEARVIARDAYVFGFPLVDNYRILHSYFVDRGGGEYKGPFNQISNTARVYTPDDRVIQTPNSDTPYSTIGADLRAEPIVISTPTVEPNRYFSLQFIDLYTFNFAYTGSRATGNRAQTIVLAGPDWAGEAPAGTRLIRCETDLALVLIRTQLLDPEDLDNVKAIQAGYSAQPLSSFLGKPATSSAPALAFPKPLASDEQRISARFFEVLDFLLSLCPPHREDARLREQLARLGVNGRSDFMVASLAPDIRVAVETGISDAWVLYQMQDKLVASGHLSSGDIFGSREFLAGNYLNRMVAAVDGIYGNSREEAVYPGYVVDAEGRPIDTSLDTFELRFAPGQLPPVNAFWSLTMYELPDRLLIANPLSRYLINSPMLPALKRDADGGLTVYVQRDTPGPAKESNWLPAPNGPLFMVLRLYWPKTEALDGRWKAPPLRRVG